MRSGKQTSEKRSETSSTALRLEGIEKGFFGVPVLKGIHFELGTGRTLGLVGENGAGKSTLMNLLGGNLTPDTGKMRLWGQPYAPANPSEAEEKGIAFVHQELNLFDNLSIAENLFLNRFPTRGGLIRYSRIDKATRDVLSQVGLDLSPSLQMDQLSAGERQLVEIAKALNRDARLIILDEPTTSLTDHEAERLFRLLEQLHEKGITMIYISHALEEVMRLADDILVLRDGDVIAFGEKRDFSKAKMITAMVGRDIEQLFPERTHAPKDEIAFKASHVSKRGVVKDISFELKKGEVLGVSGLMGSGRTELARILFGLDSMDAGEVFLGQKSIAHQSPQERITAGMAFLTEDRRDEGLLMDASIEDNMTLASAGRFAKGPARWLNQSGLNAGVKEYRDAVRLTATAKNEQAVKTLSGGNQQKVVLAKWLLNHPRVIILDEPTRGIDIGAKFEIYSLINELTARGAALLVISSELEELIGICDRILTLSQGEITAEFERSRFDREEILKAALK